MEDLLDIIFPKKCGNCGKVSRTWICDSCFENLKYGNIQKIEKGEINYLISLFSYVEIREKMLKFKFNDEAYMYNYFVELICRNEKIKGIIKKCDLIIPVPMYFLKKLKRGYNQSELIANGIGKALKIKINNNILVKYKNTKTQSLLNSEKRKYNLKDCFKLQNTELLKNKNVLLVDDIYTTGITIQECINQLKKSEVSNISVFVIAKGE